jgi:hypothetical protein
MLAAEEEEEVEEVAVLCKLTLATASHLTELLMLLTNNSQLRAAECASIGQQ